MPGWKWMCIEESNYREWAWETPEDKRQVCPSVEGTQLRVDGARAWCFAREAGNLESAIISAHFSHFFLALTPLSTDKQQLRWRTSDSQARSKFCQDRWVERISEQVPADYRSWSIFSFLKLTSRETKLVRFGIGKRLGSGVVPRSPRR